MPEAFLHLSALGPEFSEAEARLRAEVAETTEEWRAAAADMAARVRLLDLAARALDGAGLDARGRAELLEG